MVGKLEGGQMMPEEQAIRVKIIILATESGKNKTRATNGILSIF